MFSNHETSFSLEKTIQWTLGILLFTVLITLIAAGAWVGREASLKLVLTGLEHDAEAIIAGLDLEQNKISRALPPIYNQPLSGYYFVLTFPDGSQTRSRSLWDSDLEVAPLTVGKTASGVITGPEKKDLFYWQASYKKQDKAFSIVVAEDVSATLSAIQRFFWTGLLIALAAASLILLTQKYLLRLGFSRLDRVRQNVSDIAQGKSDRLELNVPVEIKPLVEEFNQLLLSWKAHLARSRNATGNLAHAIKAPLNLIYQYSKEADNAAIARQAEQIQHQLASELDRARLAGSAAIGKRFCPHEDIPDLIDTIRLLHRDKGLEIETDILVPDYLPFDQSDMLEMFGNILDNAAKWAARRIKLKISGKDSIQIQLDDDGPGIEENRLNAILERGTRLDENKPGHGLGLSIVNEIVQLYKGTITLQKSDMLDGLSIHINLPYRDGIQ